MMNAGGINVFSIPGQLVVYAALQFTAVMKSYSLTYEFPAAILSWMGVNSTHADLGEREAQQHTNVIAGRLTGGMGLGKPGGNAPLPPPKVDDPTDDPQKNPSGGGSSGGSDEKKGYEGRESKQSNLSHL
jgi:hypothetical protein